MVKGLDDFNRQRSKMKILSLQKIFGVMQPIFIVKEDFGIQKKNSIEKVRYMESLLYQVYKRGGRGWGEDVLSRVYCSQWFSSC